MKPTVKKNKTLNTLSTIGFLLFAIPVGIYMASKTWTLGSNDDDYTTVCIGSHEYYYASFGTKGFLAIKLEGDGKPIVCE